MVLLIFLFLCLVFLCFHDNDQEALRFSSLPSGLAAFCPGARAEVGFPPLQADSAGAALDPRGGLSDLS